MIHFYYFVMFEDTRGQFSCCKDTTVGLVGEEMTALLDQCATHYSHSIRLNPKRSSGMCCYELQTEMMGLSVAIVVKGRLHTNLRPSPLPLRSRVLQVRFTTDYMSALYT